MFSKSVKSAYVVAVAALGFAAISGSAMADNTQQDKMKTCNAQWTAHHDAGADHNAFMKTCLSSAAAPAATKPADKAAPAADKAADKSAAPAKTTKLNSQQQKMKTCSADAKSKGLKGADYKSAVSTCLKSSS